LTDSEASFQAIHKWIGCGTKLNIARTPDADVLEEIVIKLQKRGGQDDPPSKGESPQHKGDPLDEEGWRMDLKNGGEVSLFSMSMTCHRRYRINDDMKCTWRKGAQ
jgi:hypothetical protein